MMKRLVIAIILSITAFATSAGQEPRSEKMTARERRTETGIMGGVGGNLGVIDNSLNRRGILGARGVFSIGTFYNRFNLEFSASPSYAAGGWADDPESSIHGFVMPVIISPRLNYCKLTNYRNHYLYLQPEFGYVISTIPGFLVTFGGGIGLEYFGAISLNIGAIVSAHNSNHFYINFGYTYYFD